MTVQITSSQMEAFAPGSGKYANAFSTVINDLNITNYKMFLAQCAEESGGFKVVTENLNYSAPRLLEVFPRYFSSVTVNSYAHNPSAIANRCYANRMGNGPESCGDGWLYRGRGFIQLTGKNNYTAFMNECGFKNMNDTINFITTDKGAVMSAAYYWYINKISDLGDDIESVTRKINGGLTNLQARKDWFAKAKRIL